MNATNTDRYRQVWRTYTTRPAFRWLAGAIVTTPLVLLVIASSSRELFSGSNVIGGFVAFALLILLPMGIPVTGAALIVAHLRRQMESWRPALLPAYRTPHLAVAAVCFLGLALLLPVEIKLFFLAMTDKPAEQIF